MRNPAKKRFQKHLTVLVCLIACLPLSCNSQSDSSADRPRQLKLAYVMAPVGAVHEAAQKFAELVEQKTDGQITVKLYPSASLGSDRELAEGLTFGSVDFVLSGLASISWYIPQYELLEAPFLFRSYEHLDKVFHGKIGREVNDALLKVKPIRILSSWYRGPRYLTTNKKIQSPADLVGIKLRVPELPTYIETWKILGANPTPITYSEMFMALKQGVVEGQENPLEVIWSSSLYEVQKYVIETRHMLSTYLLMTSDKLFAGLTHDQQKAVRDAAEEAARFEFELMQKYDKEYIEKLKEKGMEFVPVEMEPFRKPVIEKLPEIFKDKWEPNLFQRIQDIK